MLPDVALSTDMIVGFPGETDADFDDTLTLTEAVGYHSMYSFKYSPRPNTLAIKRMPDDVPEAEKTRRILALQALQQAAQTAHFEAAVGTVEISVCRYGAPPIRRSRPRRSNSAATVTASAGSPRPYRSRIAS